MWLVWVLILYYNVECSPSVANCYTVAEGVICFGSSFAFGSRGDGSYQSQDGDVVTCNDGTQKYNETSILCKVNQTQAVAFNKAILPEYRDGFGSSLFIIPLPAISSISGCSPCNLSPCRCPRQSANLTIQGSNIYQPLLYNFELISLGVNVGSCSIIPELKPKLPRRSMNLTCGLYDMYYLSNITSARLHIYLDEYLVSSMFEVPFVRAPSVSHITCGGALSDQISECSLKSISVWGSGFIGFPTTLVGTLFGNYYCTLEVVGDSLALCNPLYIHFNNAMNYELSIMSGTVQLAVFPIKFKSNCKDDLDCSGHGLCRLSTCTCYRGWASGYWAGLRCSECLGDYTLDSKCTISLQELCTPGSSKCGSHGSCDTQTRKCICTGKWDGFNCDRCSQGYAGENCNVTCSKNDGKYCSGNGKCVSVGTDVACLCDQGFSGVDCEIPCPVYKNGNKTLVCYGHGVCLMDVGVCSCYSDKELGFWTGSACTECTSMYVGPACTVPCPVYGGLVCAGFGTCQFDNGASKCNCKYGMGGVKCELQCPGGRLNPCNGHGLCIDSTGSMQCKCHNSSSTGYWEGPDCSACSPLYSGPMCNTPCPLARGVVCGGNGKCMNGLCLCTGSFCGQSCEVPIAECSPCPSNTFGISCDETCPESGGLICNGRGVCLDGRFGSGDCICNSGWIGNKCHLECPKSVSGDVCSRRGTCSGTTSAICTCFNGTGGADCGQSCPGGEANPCSGHGECYTSGNRVLCECNIGYAFSDCSKLCPIVDGEICSGKGKCDVVSGTCKCDTGFTGMCDECIQGAHGNDCTLVCVHGVTRKKSCVCDYGYGGTGCVLECPGLSSGKVCSGHGSCVSSTATCICEEGYAASDCSIECYKNAAGAICSGHGQCDAPSGLCICYNDTVRGHYDSSDCGRCGDGWYGPRCNLVCARAGTANAICNGKGVCDRQTAECLCFRNSTTGYWNGTACSTCSSGYFGINCLGVCPSINCIPCSGHGTCNEGTAGDGKCTCVSSSKDGYWIGETCGECDRSYYGLSCKSKCPVLGGQICNGHGVCNEGMFGNGKCKCSNGWDGKDCSDCSPGIFGQQCTGVCPARTNITSCSGRGWCNDGITGDGQCSCAANIAGNDCSLVCPVNSIGVACNYPRGTCNDTSRGDGTCKCVRNDTLGFWTGSTCQECDGVYAGPSCTVPCPVDRTNIICSGHGICRNGRIGDGTCKCFSGWAGLLCELECPGQASKNPCNSRGICTELGLCKCFQNETFGFWNGTGCTQCLNGYSGPNCAMQCPISTLGVCSNFGSCINGKCFCSTGRCGSACEITECSTLVCPTGRYGVSCSLFCPGYNASNGSPCSGHGRCDSTKSGTGECECSTGYSGSDCSSKCGSETHCSGGGICNPKTGRCECFEWFAGSDCSLQCPGNLSPCERNGVCDSGATGSGKCNCSTGWAGDSCSIQCPRSLSGKICGNGYCNQRSGECICVMSTVDGNWTGSDCTSCAEGYYGALCNKRCFNGKSIAGYCVCEAGYAGENCAIGCPKVNGSICSGHGTCRDGQRGDGVCLCMQNYYSDTCNTYCKASDCFTGIPQARGACSSFGECICQNNNQGRYAGKFCADCADGWYGANCTKPCICYGHGYCKRDSAKCICYNDTTNGYYTGAECKDCQDGYGGELCNQKFVLVSRSAGFRVSGLSTAAITPFDASEQTQKTDVASTTVRDDLTGDVYIGQGSSVYVCDHANKVQFTRAFPGPVIAITKTMDINPDSPSYTPVIVLYQKSDIRAGLVKLVRINATTYTLLPEEVVINPMYLNADPVSRQMKILATSDSSTPTTQVYFTGEYFIWQSNSSSTTFVVFKVSSSAKSIVVSNISSILSVDSNENGVFIAGASVSGSYLLLYVDFTGVPKVFPLHELGVPSLCDRNAIPSVYVSGISLCPRALMTRYSPSTHSVFAVLQWNMFGVLIVRYTGNRGALPFEFSSDNCCAKLKDYVDLRNKFITAMEVDDVGKTIIIAINLFQYPSEIVKIDLVTLSEVAKRVLPNIAGYYPEVVDSITLIPSSRTMLLRTLTPDVTLSIVMLYSVMGLTPPVADVNGKTEITVYIEGLGNTSTAWCQFGSEEVLALQVNPLNGTVVCPAPMLNNTNSTGSVQEHCDGQTLEIALSPGKYTQNQIRLLRPQPATLLSVSPYYQNTSGGLLTITGFGFVDTAFLRCAVVDSLGTVFVSRARFINFTAVSCLQPHTRITVSPAYVALSLDAQIYSKSSVLYAIVGEPSKTTIVYPAPITSHLDLISSTMITSNLNSKLTQVIYSPELTLNYGGLSCSSNCSSVKFWNDSSIILTEIRAGSTSRTPDLMVLKVDSEGKPLLGNANQILEFAITSTFYPSPSAINDTLLSTELTVSELANYSTQFQEGVVRISNITLTSPKVGLVVFSLTGGFPSTSLAFRVIPGFPSRMKIIRQPSGEISNGQPLSIQPSLVLIDQASNFVPKEYINENVKITVAIVAHQSNYLPFGMNLEYISSDFQGVFTFRQVSFSGYFGTKYYMVFTAFSANMNSQNAAHNATVILNSTNWIGYLEPVASTFIVVSKCRYYETYRVNTSTCIPCPDRAECDGTDRFVVKGNSWRGSPTSNNIYGCDDKIQPCLARTPTGTCKPGFTGPLCSKCLPGHYSDNCLKCPTNLAGQWSLVVIIGLLLYASLAVFIAVTATKSSQHTQALAIWMKMAVNHLWFGAKLGKLGSAIPTILNTLFTNQLSISEALLPIDSFVCIIPEINVYNYFMVFVSWPVIWIAVSAILPALYLAFIYYKSTKSEIQYRPSSHDSAVRSWDSASQLPSEAAAEPEFSFSKEAKEEATRYFVLGYLIAMYFSYPTLLRKSAEMLMCDEYIVDGVEVSYLSIDRTISCQGDSYSTWKGLATLFLLAFGALIPLGFLLAFWYKKRTSSHKRALQRFHFLTSGYRDNVALWECTIMIRKFIVTCIATFVPTGLIRSFAGILFTELVFMLQMRAKPYRDYDINSLEMVSQLCILTTVNLSTLYNFEPFNNESGWYSFVLTLFILVLNVRTFFLFLMFFVKAAIETASDLISRTDPTKYRWYHKLFLRLNAVSRGVDKILNIRKKKERAHGRRESVSPSTQRSAGEVPYWKKPRPSTGTKKVRDPSSTTDEDYYDDEKEDVYDDSYRPGSQDEVIPPLINLTDDALLKLESSSERRKGSLTFIEPFGRRNSTHSTDSDPSNQILAVRRRSSHGIPKGKQIEFPDVPVPSPTLLNGKGKVHSERGFVSDPFTEILAQAEKLLAEYSLPSFTPLQNLYTSLCSVTKSKPMRIVLQQLGQPSPKRIVVNQNMNDTGTLLSVLGIISKLEDLEVLALVGCNITDFELPIVRDCISKLNNLKCVDLSANNLTDELSIIQLVARNPKIKVKIAGTPISKDGKQFFSANDTSETFVLQSASTEDDALLPIVHDVTQSDGEDVVPTARPKTSSEPATPITSSSGDHAFYEYPTKCCAHIYVTTCSQFDLQPQPQVEAYFSKHNMSEIKSFQIPNISLKPSFKAVVKTLASCTSLTTIDLSFCSINDVMVESLCTQFSGLRHLQRLNLSGNEITEKSVVKLDLLCASSKERSNIEMVVLVDRTKIGERSALRLRGE